MTETETETRRVLIVDDEKDIRDSVADILNDSGYEADAAADGEEALARTRDIHTTLARSQ